MARGSDSPKAAVWRRRVAPGATGCLPASVDTGTEAICDRVEFEYNRQGQLVWKKDQNGTIHEFDYDDLGRQTQDRVTTVGSGVDDAVLRLGTSYEVRGQADAITSYDNATAGSGSAVNQVVFEYDDVGLLSKEYQEHAGAKDASTLYVQYNHDTSASSGQFTKGLRPTSVRYPNGRLVHYTYGTSSGAGDSLNRLNAIKDDNAGSPGDTLASYSYLGQNTIVIEDYEEPDVRLEYFSGGTYSGFDRFGRVIDQKWHDYGASTDRDRYTYAYDRASNRIYRENTMASGFDEFYSYDGVNRLATADRGTLNATKTAIIGTPPWQEDWSLDPTGNWTDYLQKTSGTTDLDQSRTQNTVNEITTITATTGPNWADPVQDRAGNMTTIPKPADPANGLTAKYDAWNRLAEVKDGATAIGRYEYDGRNRRVKRHIDTDSPSSPNGLDTYIHYFHNNSWQTLETRQTTTAIAQPETLQPKHQYTYSPRYIDAPILRDENTDSDSLCNDHRLYYLGDANFNITTLVDTAGDAVERYVYTPYGKPTIYDGSLSNTRNTSSDGNVVLYTGRELDPESGMMHYRNRYYHAEVGRFLVRDPLGFVTRHFSLYSYVEGAPPMQVDPMGLESRSSGDKGKTKEKQVQELWKRVSKAKDLGDFWDAIKRNPRVGLGGLVDAKGWTAILTIVKGLEDFGDSKACKDWYKVSLRAIKRAADGKIRCGSCGPIRGREFEECSLYLLSGGDGPPTLAGSVVYAHFDDLAIRLSRDCVAMERCYCHRPTLPGEKAPGK